MGYEIGGHGLIGGRSLRIALRALQHRRAQTLVTVLVVAVLAAVAAAAPWYARMTRDQQAADTFTADGAAGSWRVTSLSLSVPDSFHLDHRLATDEVAGIFAPLGWFGGDTTEWGEGGVLARDDVCEHVEFEVGRCPTRPGEVAVSAADVDAWGFEVGGRLRINAAAENPAPLGFRIVGVYRVTDPASPYWYQLLPTGRSGYRDQEIPVADQFLTPPATFEEHADLEGAAYVDARIDPSRVRAADLDQLRTSYDELERRVRDAGGVATSEFGRSEASARLDGQLTTTLEGLDNRFEAADTVLGLTFAQVAALGLVVLGLLAGLVGSSARQEIALRRLRGQRVGRVTRAVTGEWLLVALPGVLFGAVLAVGVAALARGRWLSDAALLSPPRSSGLALAVVPLLGSALVAVAVCRAARRPIPDLLRVTGPRVAAGGSWPVDLMLLTAAGCALLAGLTSGDGSTLVLLAPVLLALAAGVVASRGLAIGCARLGRRRLVDRPAVALAGCEIARRGGLRSAVAVPAVAVALVVLTTQAALIGDRNRDHRAEVETGAATVLTTAASPLAVERALDALDPDRERATMVVRAGRSDGRLRTMYVEPRAFPRIAYGANDAAPAAEWQRLAAPEQAPIFRGTQLRVRFDGSATGPVTLWLRYTDGDGVGREVSGGTLHSGARPASRTGPHHTGQAPRRDRREVSRQVSVDCADGCRLVSLSFSPDGAAELSAVVRIDAERSGTWQPVVLDPDRWRPVLPDVGGYRFDLTGDGTGLAAKLSSGGLSVIAQSSDTPDTPAALVSAVHSSDATQGLEVPTPGSRRLPVDVVGTLADATPQLLTDTVLVDVAAVTRYGEATTGSDTAVQLWLPEGADPAALTRDLADHDIGVTPSADVRAARAEFAASAEALAVRVNPAVAVLALLLAAGCLLLSIAGRWRARADDLDALAAVGVPRGLLLRATVLSLVVPCLVGVVAGAAAGTVGTVIATRRMQIFGAPEPAIHAQLSLLPVPLAAAVALAAVAVAAVAAGTAWRLSSAASDSGAAR